MDAHSVIYMQITFFVTYWSELELRNKWKYSMYSFNFSNNTFYSMFRYITSFTIIYFCKNVK